MSDFASWKTLAAQGFGPWQLDEGAYFDAPDNGGKILRYYRGNDSRADFGVYVEVRADGVAEVGRYEGAVPRFADARRSSVFARKVADDLATAAQQVIGRLNEWLPEKIPAQLPLLPGVTPGTSGKRRRSSR